MKAVINEKETEVKDEYPKLMVSTEYQTHPGLIALFFDASKAMVLVPNTNNNDYHTGYVTSTFVLSAFIPFTGSITLSND